MSATSCARAAGTSSRRFPSTASASPQALGTPPAAARPHLERLAELQAEIHAGLSAGRAFTLQKIGSMSRGATAMRGYAGPAPARHALSVDRRALAPAVVGLALIGSRP